MIMMCVILLCVLHCDNNNNKKTIKRGVGGGGGEAAFNVDLCSCVHFFVACGMGYFFPIGNSARFSRERFDWRERRNRDREISSF